MSENFRGGGLTHTVHMYLVFQKYCHILTGSISWSVSDFRQPGLLDWLAVGYSTNIWRLCVQNSEIVGSGLDYRDNFFTFQIFFDNICCFSVKQDLLQSYSNDSSNTNNFNNLSRSSVQKLPDESWMNINLWAWKSQTIAIGWVLNRARIGIMWTGIRKS